MTPGEEAARQKAESSASRNNAGVGLVQRRPDIGADWWSLEILRPLASESRGRRGYIRVDSFYFTTATPIPNEGHTLKYAPGAVMCRMPSEVRAYGGNLEDSLAFSAANEARQAKKQRLEEVWLSSMRCLLHPAS